jgi:hypothetical protein
LTKDDAVTGPNAARIQEYRNRLEAEARKLEAERQRLKQATAALMTEPTEPEPEASRRFTATATTDRSPSRPRRRGGSGARARAPRVRIADSRRTWRSLTPRTTSRRKQQLLQTPEPTDRQSLAMHLYTRLAAAISDGCDGAINHTGTTAAAPIGAVRNRREQLPSSASGKQYSLCPVAKQKSRISGPGGRWYNTGGTTTK